MGFRTILPFRLGLDISLVALIALLMPVALAERGIGGTDIAAVAPASEQRSALVIGNGSYRNASPLINPINDAKDMTAALKSLGFNVTTLLDASLRKMEEAVDAFGQTIRHGGVALFFFAGHGANYAGDNYLFPVDASVSEANEIRYECVNAGRILAKMQSAGTRVNIVMLDACRNNPYARGWRDETKGLGAMAAPKGSIISYATGEGRVASENVQERNGLYTKYLLENMRKPGMELHRVFMNTRIAVAKATNDKQIPAEYNQLMGEFYFSRGPYAVGPGTHPEAPGPIVVRPDVPPAPSKGMLQVNVNVAGASIEVDGKSAGRASPGAPVSIRDLPGGEAVAVLVTKDGYLPLEQKVHIRAGQSMQVVFELEPSPVEPPALYVHVCKDAGAGGYEAFPDVCRLEDGRLMCVFYAGYGHVALPNAQLPRGGRVSCCLSSDEGRTWTDAAVLYDGPDDDRDPSIAQLESGRLICNFFSLRKAEGKSPPWTGLGSWMVHSGDLGATWSEPKCIVKDYYCSAPVRQLSDGALILGLYAEKDGQGWGAVTLSGDDGETWSDVIDIDNNGMPLDAETDIIELKDGTLYAAQRGRGKTMAWAASKDRGKTWSVSEPYGFPGHCPYLHRTLDDIILMAHRLPSTSLHYSLDECKTWSENVLVDEVGGAYPSMVTLKDGTVLIVYYEEGEGSSIRAKRFLATHTGIQWMPVSEGPVPGATLVSYRKIWDAAPHNAFTNLAYWKDAWYCVFREGQGHVSPDGALRVITSRDGTTWESAAHITSDTADLRDAQITVTPEGGLMLSGAAALHQPAPIRHQTMAYFSDDGQSWSEGIEIGDPDLWLWRITWHKDTAYGIGYATGEGKRFIRLYKSADGKRFETLVENLLDEEYPNETSLVFLEDDTCLCLLRRGGTGMLGEAQPPYTDWTWKDLGVGIGGPHMIQLPDGRFVAAVRLYDGKARTGLCWIDREKGTLTEFLTLPSGGDTSYAGMVWHDGLLWVSYYASHEGRTSIYLAKVKF